MTKRNLFTISILTGSVLTETLFMFGTLTNKLPNPIYFIWAFWGAIAAIIGGNVNQPNPFIWWIGLVLFFSILCYCILSIFRRFFRIQWKISKNFNKVLISLISGMSMANVVITYGYESNRALPEPLATIWRIVRRDDELTLGNCQPIAVISGFILFTIIFAIISYMLIAVTSYIIKRKVEPGSSLD